MSNEITAVVQLAGATATKVLAAKERADEVASRFEQFHSDARESLEGLASVHQVLVSSVQQYREEVTDSQAEIATRLDSLLAAIDGWGGASTDLVNELETVVSDVLTEVQAFGGRKEAQLQILSQLSSQTENVVADLSSTVASEVNAMKSISQKCVSELEKLTQTSVDMDQKSGQVAGSVGASFQQHGQEITGRLSEIVNSIEDGCDQCDEESVELGDDLLLTKLDAFAEKIRQAVLETMKAGLDEGLQSMSEAVQNAISGIDEAEQEDADLRNEIRPIIDEVDALIEPLESLAGHVQEVAKKLSSFGF